MLIRDQRYIKLSLPVNRYDRTYYRRVTRVCVLFAARSGLFGRRSPCVRADLTALEMSLHARKEALLLTPRIPAREAIRIASTLHRPLQFHAVAFGIVKVDRRTAAFGAVARCFLAASAVRGKMARYRGRVERFHPQAEVIEIGARHAREATASRRARCRSACGRRVAARAALPQLQAAAEHLGVEFFERRRIAGAQHHVIEADNREGCARRLPASVDQLDLAPIPQRCPQAAIEPEPVGGRRRVERGHPLEHHARPLEAALLQHPPRRRVGHPRTGERLGEVEIAEGVVDRARAASVA